MRNAMNVVGRGVLPIVLLLMLLLSSGCSSLSPTRSLGSRYYLIEVEECKQIDDRPQTDHQIVKCGNQVASILWERMNNARLARSTGGVIQVVTAAVSAMLTGTAGSAAVNAATALSGTSAIVPDLSEVIGARERAEVYSEGAKTIEEAEARYWQNIAEQGLTGEEQRQIFGTKLTPAGAEFYGAIVGAIHVVEDRLTGKLPTVEDLRKARPVPLSLSGSTITNLQTASDPVKVQVIRGGPAVTATSSNLSVARVTLEDSGMTMAITRVGPGGAIITVKNESGGSAVVSVK